MAQLYQFPGTWTKARIDTTQAAKSTFSASVDYCRAVGNSGIATAGMSVGTALMSSMNRGALQATALAVQASGTDRNQLPRVVNLWLETKDEMDVSRERARKAKEFRENRKLVKGMIRRGEVTLMVPERERPKSDASKVEFKAGGVNPEALVPTSFLPSTEDVGTLEGDACYVTHSHFISQGNDDEISVKNLTTTSESKKRLASPTLSQRVSNNPWESSSNSPARYPNPKASGHEYGFDLASLYLDT